MSWIDCQRPWCHQGKDVPSHDRVRFKSVLSPGNCGPSVGSILTRTRCTNMFGLAPQISESLCTCLSRLACGDVRQGEAALVCSLSLALSPIPLPPTRLSHVAASATLFQPSPALPPTGPDWLSCLQMRNSKIVFSKQGLTAISLPSPPHPSFPPLSLFMPDRCAMVRSVS